jgi:peptide/nickel transport system substrate-binding protein
MVRTGVVDPNLYRMILHSDAVPPKGQNRGRYKNPQFDRLIEAGNHYTNPEERRPYYLKAQEIFARDLPYIPLYTKINYTVLAAGLEGYTSYPSGELFSLRQMAWR